MFRSPFVQPEDNPRAYTPKQAGYVECDVPKQCRTCVYYEAILDHTKENRGICHLPLSITVHPTEGCCNYWMPQGKKKC